MAQVHSRRSTRELRIRIATLSALVLVACCLAWLYLRPPELVRGARSTLHALQSGDKDKLFNSMSSMEGQCSGLTPEKLQEAWNVLVSERLAQSDVVGIEPAVMASNGTQATASTTYQDRNGKKWSFAVIANQTDDGPKSLMIFPMLLSAGRSLDKPLDGATTVAIIRRLRPKLEKIGIHKIMLNPSNCPTWDELEARLSKSIELGEQRKKEQGSVYGPK